jgi:16S rRNA (guanine527-N7)-methyltransferase
VPLSDSLLGRLQRGATSLGVSLTVDAEAGFGRYLDLLLRWNERINLTAVRDPESIVERHFVDSLAVLKHLPAAATSLVDVGSGPGFPGAVLALVRPELAVTMVESNHKKCAFLETLRRELPLPKARVLSQRIEDVLAKPNFVPFDVAVSRATLDLLDWLNLGSRLVRRDGTGVVLGMEGADIRDLPPGATRHPYDLGAATRAVIVFHVERS